MKGSDEECHCTCACAVNNCNPVKMQAQTTAWRGLFSRGTSPAASIQPKLHRGAVPVLAAREALVRGIEVNRFYQLRPDTGTLCDDAFDAHQRAQIRGQESSRADMLVSEAV